VSALKSEFGDEELRIDRLGELIPSRIREIDQQIREAERRLSDLRLRRERLLEVASVLRLDVA